MLIQLSLRQKVLKGPPRFHGAPRRQQGLALEQGEGGMVGAFQFLQPFDRGERLARLAAQHEQMGQGLQDFRIRRLELRRDQEIGRAALDLAVATIEMAQQVQQLYGVLPVGQLSVSFCSRAIRSR
ncbi:hypothetical protein ACETRX_24780 [Labrys portucalensis]|uniref:Uncharacterized protein n=1 Tax=Labrys neptuniae TaxID=376174 RepID=A0ABV6ZL22_9HYPH